MTTLTTEIQLRLPKVYAKFTRSNCVAVDGGDTISIRKKSCAETCRTTDIIKEVDQAKQRWVSKTSILRLSTNQHHWALKTPYTDPTIKVLQHR